LALRRCNQPDKANGTVAAYVEIAVNMILTKSIGNIRWDAVPEQFPPALSARIFIACALLPQLRSQTSISEPFYVTKLIAQLPFI